MLKRILMDPMLAVILSDIDHDLAEQVRSGGCLHCGDVLHSACYPRKPRCGQRLPADWCVRLSFCCAREGCRRRNTPPSVRFLSRHLYPTILIVLITAMAHGITTSRRRTLEAAFGVDRRTLERWRRWWQEIFAKSALWKSARTRFLAWRPQDSIPRWLLRHFAPLHRDRLMALLRFLAPISV